MKTQLPLIQARVSREEKQLVAEAGATRDQSESEVIREAVDVWTHIGSVDPQLGVENQRDPDANLYFRIEALGIPKRRLVQVAVAGLLARLQAQKYVWGSMQPSLDAFLLLQHDNISPEKMFEGLYACHLAIEIKSRIRQLRQESDKRALTAEEQEWLDTHVARLSNGQINGAASGVTKALR